MSVEPQFNRLRIYNIQPMLTVRDVARLLHIHSNTVRRWSNKGIMRAYRINQRGDRRFRQEDITRILLELNANGGSPSTLEYRQ